MSYSNMVLYASVLPTYGDTKSKDTFDASKDANNPANFNETEDEIIRR